jgi:predicted ATPase
MIDKVAEWLKKLGLVSEFQLKPIDGMKRFYEPRVKVGSEQTDNSLIDVGFGISQVLPVITQLFSVPEHSIVLLEQPELHLHPSAQAGLADLFLEVAETRHLQLIIESHSEHLLARLQRRIAESENAFASPEHIKMYFCEPGEEGSTIQPVEVDRFGQIANWPKNFFGDISGDLEAMSRAGLKRRKEELAGVRQRRES